jgi:putative glutamine amidotransferase
VTTVVGIAGEELVVRKHFGEQLVAAAPCAVVTAVRAAGGTPVVLPPGTVDATPLEALVLTGGGDVGADPARDRNELTLLAAARRTGLPTLGICRGLQLMAIETGGRLVEELGDDHLIWPPGTHDLQTVPGSLAAALVPGRRVGSLHHQAVATHDDRWRCTAIGPGGVVEALEWADPTAWPALGVQWHPELDGTGAAVFRWLVRTAAQPRRRTSGVTCFSALYNPLTYRSTGTGTASPVRATAS